MKYKLIQTATKPKEIDQALLKIMSDQQHFCDSILETEDRIIVRYVERVFKSRYSPNHIDNTVLYIHFSKKDLVFTKICIYKLEELIDEKDIQKKN